MTVQVCDGHTVLAAVPLLPTDMDPHKLREMSAAICDRLKQRRMDALLGKKRVSRDAIDVFIDSIPDRLPEAVA